ncbi:MAG TPA: DUF3575 domain-containing protein [Saprospiraceae bacterium]|nr:DUF3575 domain-containing protein [Saprospiraceae bacterium]HPI05824.1 DUF3575 domain-containing protein [Saprospiraceae bacterium]
MRREKLHRISRFIRTTLLLCLLSSCVFAQKNVVKGRVFYLPPARGLQVFSLGIGLERRIGDDFSLQLLYNLMGSDMGATDGGGTSIRGFVPEVRYYFGKKKTESINKAFFGSVFTEFNQIRYSSGGEIDPDAVNVFRHKATSVNPGILLGKNARLSDRWYLEFYVGGKARFTKETKTRVENGLSSTTETRFVKAGMRGGINLGYRF